MSTAALYSILHGLKDIHKVVLNLATDLNNLFEFVCIPITE